MKIDAEGYLIDDSGNRILHEGQPIKVEGVLTQAKVDEIVESRLARQKKQLKEENEQKISELEEKIKNSVSAEEKATLEARIEQLKEQNMTAEEKARQAANAEINEYKKQKSEAEKAAQKWESEYKNSTVRNSILSTASKLRFLNGDDLVHILSPNITWTDEKDDEGKATGKQIPRVVMGVKNDKDEIEERFLTIEEASKVVANEKQYLIAGTNRGGHGGLDQSLPHPSQEQLNGMSAKGKMAHAYNSQEH